jgi:hypothetical protein
MLCDDIMELIGEQVRVVRITQENKQRFNLVVEDIKHKRGNFKRLNLKLLIGWF